MEQKTGKTKSPRYLQIKDLLKEKILKGVFRKSLPGEQSLAEEFGVSYMTVRRAVSALIDEGLLVRRRGSGTYVASPGLEGSVSTKTILFYRPGSDKEGRGGDPYYNEIFYGIEKAARALGYDVIVSASPIANGVVGIFDRENPYYGKVEGIITPVDNREELVELARFKPIVFLGDWQTEKRLPSVYADTYKAGCLAMEHLIEKGHRRIALLVHEYEVVHNSNRYKAYCDSLEKHKIALDTSLIFSSPYDNEFDYAVKGADYFSSMKERPTAVFCHNDTLALGLMKGLQRNGINVPDEISVMGVNDIATADQIFPGLTTVRIPMEELGGKAFELLIALIEGKEKVSDAKQLEVALTIVERESVKTII